MSDPVVTGPATEDAKAREFTRIFIAIALLLSAGAIASMVIAVTRPTSDASLLDYPQPGEVFTPVIPIAGLHPDSPDTLIEPCLPGTAIRLMSPRHIEAVRVCSMGLVAQTTPVTILNTKGRAEVFAELASQLSLPDELPTANTACSAVTYPPTVVAVRIGGQWYRAQVPTTPCGPAPWPLTQLLLHMMGAKL
jgi:hypothetical protein